MYTIKNILIIEDDEDHAFLEKDILEEEIRSNVHIVNSGMELDKVHLPLFDIILLDFNLPDITGMEVIEKIRNQSDVPIILITGHSELKVAIETLKKGANDFLIKSTETINMLPAVCKKVFNDYIMKKELETKQKESDLIRARIETLSQTLTTLAHYINNSTTTISGYAQLCEQNPDNPERAKKLVYISLKETNKITKVLKELERLVNSMDLRTTDYVNIPNAMFAIEAMAMGKPVLCFLREDLLNLYAISGLIKPDEIPIINCGPFTVKDTLRYFLAHRDKLASIGRKSREFVLKHHSLEIVGEVFHRINTSIGILPSGYSEEGSTK